MVEEAKLRLRIDYFYLFFSQVDTNQVQPGTDHLPAVSLRSQCSSHIVEDPLRERGSICFNWREHHQVGAYGCFVVLTLVCLSVIFNCISLSVLILSQPKALALWDSGKVITILALWDPRKVITILWKSTENRLVHQCILYNCEWS